MISSMSQASHIYIYFGFMIFSMWLPSFRCLMVAGCLLQLHPSFLCSRQDKEEERTKYLVSRISFLYMELSKKSYPTISTYIHWTEMSHMATTVCKVSGKCKFTAENVVTYNKNQGLFRKKERMLGRIQPVEKESVCKYGRECIIKRSESQG